MWRAGLIAMLVALGSGFSVAEQARAPMPAAQAATTPRPVKVYAARSGVKKPRLLPLSRSVALTKKHKCGSQWDGETRLSLLVDTKGQPRNIMFLSPAGSPVDWLAVAVAEHDRFQPATLNGVPVIVAETLQLKLDTCVVEVDHAKGKVTADRVLRKRPHQKLIKPQNPPHDAVLTPLNTAPGTLKRKVTRPDFFGGNITAPVLLYSVDADYTPMRRGAPIRGVCKIGLVVDAHGLPRDEHILQPLDPGLDRSALAAVNMYRFFPAIKNNDEPVPAAVVVDVKFMPPR